MSNAMDFGGTPGAGASGGFGGDSGAGNGTVDNQFTIKDKDQARTLLTDFECQIYGDQGRRAGISKDECIWFSQIYGRLKQLLDRLVYAGVDDAGY